ncbi:hypothetical protein ACI65C_007416 [Semiaphis heraclei]
MSSDANQCLYFISLHENQPKPKMGAEKVSMNIVVVGQVQSSKAINKVAKATPATSQLMISQTTESIEAISTKYMIRLHLVSFHENQPKSKMGAEKVSMNIVVVGQVQSSKAINKVAKAAPATSQSMANDELNILLFGVIQSSVLRRQIVPENSVKLDCCHEALGMSDLPKTLMELVGNVKKQTFLDDLLKLSYSVVAVSDRSAIRMIQSDGVRILVDTLKPNFLWMPLVSFDRFTVCEFVIMLLNRMFSVWSSQSSTSDGDLQPPARVARNTLEILLCNIKIETERNNENSMKLRNDFCYLLGEIVENCSIDEEEYSVDIVTDIVMLCVWPEIIHISHWLEDVAFNPVNENYVLKSIMLDITNKMFTNFSSKIEFQQLNTFLIKEFITLLNVEYSKNIYGDNLYSILNRLLLNLPYLLLNSVDSSIKTECCTELLALIKSLKEQKNFSCTIVNAIICIGIVSNDDYDLLRKFKTLKADVLINCNHQSNQFIHVKVWKH